MTKILDNVSLPEKKYRYGVRNIARKENKTQYFTGEPCVNGHICNRYVLSKNCIECSRIRKRGKYKQKKKEWWLKNIYGLTKEQYNQLLWNQGYCCVLCENKLNLFKETHVDHDHDSGKIRGILCHSCNVGLGHLKHNPELLRKAALYCEVTR